MYGSSAKYGSDVVRYVMLVGERRSCLWIMEEAVRMDCISVASAERGRQLDVKIVQVWV